MATPADDSRICASGGVISAGRYHLPAWRRAMAPGTVIEVGSNTLSSLNPNNNPVINPNYPAVAEWNGSSGHGAIVSAWCGASWDDLSGRLTLPLGGGHNDYGGNEPYSICLLDEAPAWSMIRPPSGAVGNVLTTNDGLESTGYYADGRPRSIHSYNKFIDIPGQGVLLSVQGSTWYSGQSGTPMSLLMNPVTGEWTHVATHPSSPTSSGAACYDSLRNRVWVKFSANGYPSYLDVSDWSWHATTLHYDNTYANKNTVYLPELDLVFQSDTKASGFCVWSPTGGALYEPGVSGLPPAGLTLNGVSGIAWDGTKILVWNNASNTQVVGTLTPGNSATGDPWVWGSLPFTGAVPTAAVANGTFGRFRYSKRLKGCVLQNETNQKTYFFATE